MSPVSPRARRSACLLARTAAVMSALMLALSVWTFVDGGRHGAAAATAGTASIVVPTGDPAAGQPLTSGGSATGFAIALPTNSACTGDSAAGGYRVHSFIVPSSVDPNTLTFNSTGPLPAGTGASLRQPLFDTSSNPYVNAQTDIAQNAGDGGVISGIPAFNFAVFGASGPDVVPAGSYLVGIACTLGDAGPTQLDKFWTATMTFVVDPADSPSGITWTTAAGPVDTTTTTDSTTVDGSTTSTTSGSGATTTTVRSGSSTSLAGSGSTVAAASTGGSPTGTAVLGTLPVTGKSTTAMIVWAVLLLVFGRMAVLLARAPRILPPG